MRTLRLALALGPLTAMILACSASSAAPPPKTATAVPQVNGDASATPAIGGASAGAPASSGAHGGGSGGAHFEITGPDAASGDVKFARSTLNSTDAENPGALHSLLFQNGALSISITFPLPSCGTSAAFPECGKIALNTATVSLHDAGWRGQPLPAGPSCTWDTSKLTIAGGTGGVACVNAVNSAHPATPDTIRITFTYHDPAPGQL